MAAPRHFELLHRNLESLSLRVQLPGPSTKAAPGLLLPLIHPPLQSHTLAPPEVIQIPDSRGYLEYRTHTLRHYRITKPTVGFRTCRHRWHAYLPLGTVV